MKVDVKGRHFLHQRSISIAKKNSHLVSSSSSTFNLEPGRFGANLLCSHGIGVRVIEGLSSGALGRNRVCRAHLN